MDPLTKFIQEFFVTSKEDELILSFTQPLREAVALKEKCIFTTIMFTEYRGIFYIKHLFSYLTSNIGYFQGKLFSNFFMVIR